MIRMAKRTTIQVGQRGLSENEEITPKSRMKRAFRIKTGKTEYDIKWADFAISVKEEIDARLMEEKYREDQRREMKERGKRCVQKGLSPYDSVSSIMKRKAYLFVRYHEGRVSPAIIESAIDEFRHNIEDFKTDKYKKNLKPIKTSYKLRPFYYVLLGLQAQEYFPNRINNKKTAKNTGMNFQFGKHDVSRFANELEYAHRHNVPVEFLIGFLLQTGTIHNITEWSANPDHREHWFKAKSKGSQCSECKQLVEDSKAVARELKVAW